MPDMFAPNRLFLLDAMALIYRAHFALIRAPRYTSGGTCTSAVFGVTNTLLDILKKEEPTTKVAVKKVVVKKAPTKKSLPGGRRGIRVKDDDDS